MEILLVEDDPRISSFLIKGLTENQFMVQLAQSAEVARDLLNQKNWGIILLDIMLPGMDGVEFTKLVRYKNNDTPILALSALSGVDDKVRLLDSGADDYMVKPFHFDELLSRINALIRRSDQKYRLNPKIIDLGPVKINKDEYSVYLNGKKSELSPTEYKLLCYLADNRNKVVTRTRILNSVWGINYQNNTNVVDVYISYLRSKLETNGQKLIHTIKGVGYMIKD